MIRAAVVALLLALAACTTTQAMQRYVGGPVENAMLRNGPPANAFDMPDGARAFQWVHDYSIQTPTYVRRSGQVSVPASNAAVWTSNTAISGGRPVQGRCVYTLLARWDPARNAWIVYDFDFTPSLACQ